MNRKILSSLQLILIFVLFFYSHTQNGFSQNGSTKKQISILAGYSPVHIGSKIDHDKRFALSFRLKKDQLMYDFDFEFYTSSNTWSGLVRNNELWVSTNSQETSGFLV
ncbi:MAG: hypothetical protein ACE5HS_21640, partial [bacterium]